MSTVKNKRKLREIAKVTIKSMLILAEPQEQFGDSSLSEDEKAYIHQVYCEVADKLTDREVMADTTKIVELLIK